MWSLLPPISSRRRRASSAAALSLPGVSLGLVSHEPAERLPAEIRDRLAAHYRVADALDPVQLVTAVQAISAQIGPIDCLMGPLEELQVPMAEVREALGIPGIDVETARNFRDKDRMKRILNDAGSALRPASAGGRARRGDGVHRAGRISGRGQASRRLGLPEHIPDQQPRSGPGLAAMVAPGTGSSDSSGGIRRG